MGRLKELRVKLSEDEANKLKFYADVTDRSISEVIRDYIKRLPNRRNTNIIDYEQK